MKCNKTKSFLVFRLDVIELLLYNNIKTMATT